MTFCAGVAAACGACPDHLLPLHVDLRRREQLRQVEVTEGECDQFVGQMAGRHRSHGRGGGGCEEVRRVRSHVGGVTHHHAAALAATAGHGHARLRAHAAGGCRLAHAGGAARRAAGAGQARVTTRLRTVARRVRPRGDGRHRRQRRREGGSAGGVVGALHGDDGPPRRLQEWRRPRVRRMREAAAEQSARRWSPTRRPTTDAGCRPLVGSTLGCRVSGHTTRALDQQLNGKEVEEAGKKRRRRAGGRPRHQPKGEGEDTRGEREGEEQAQPQ